MSDSGRIVAMHLEGKTGVQLVMFALMLGGAVAGFRRLHQAALGMAEVPDTEDSPFDWRVLPW